MDGLGGRTAGESGKKTKINQRVACLGGRSPFRNGRGREQKDCRGFEDREMARVANQAILRMILLVAKRVVPDNGRALQCHESDQEQ